MPEKRTTSQSEAEILEQHDPSPATVSLRKQLQAALRDNNRLKKQVGDDERLFEAIRDSIPLLGPYQHAPIRTPKGAKNRLEAALILCDAHSEETVDPEEIEGLAKYDWATFEKRMKLVGDKALRLIRDLRHTAQIDVLHVWLLGDWFLGQIHPDEMAWGSSMPLPSALPRASIVVGDALLRLAPHFGEMHVVGLCGNHGRSTTKPVTKMSADRNWDYSLYLIAEALTQRERRIDWTIPRSRAKVVDVLGWKNLLTHGDICKRTHTISYFGIINGILKEHNTRRRTDEDFDYAWMGHWHHRGLLENTVRICPPIIGHNQYAQYEMHQRSPAGAFLALFSKRHGPVSEWPIHLE